MESKSKIVYNTYTVYDKLNSFVIDNNLWIYNNVHRYIIGL